MRLGCDNHFSPGDSATAFNVSVTNSIPGTGLSQRFISLRSQCFKKRILHTCALPQPQLLLHTWITPFLISFPFRLIISLIPSLIPLHRSSVFIYLFSLYFPQARLSNLATHSGFALQLSLMQYLRIYQLLFSLLWNLLVIHCNLLHLICLPNCCLIIPLNILYGSFAGAIDLSSASVGLALLGIITVFVTI